VRFVIALALLVGLVVVACGGDDSGDGGSSNGGTPPACTEPCQPGDMCFQPAEGNCNGSWYCWDDAKWHCAPPDASSPGEAGPVESGSDVMTTEGGEGGNSGDGGTGGDALLD